ncbi:FecR family protein [Flavitalea flava]
MPETRMTYLLYRYFNDEASGAETEELVALLDKPENEQAIQAVLEESWESFGGNKLVFTAEQSRSMLSQILPDNEVPVRKLFPAGGWMSKMRWAAAAVLIGFLLVSYWWISRQQNVGKADIVIASRPAHDARPGTNGAVLTLADGSDIQLDSAGNGNLGMQGGTKLIRQADGKLMYQQGNAAAVLYNTLTTPRGKQFQVELPDGTKVWLNAASSIRYPTAFIGKERRVQITGEAYFEVTQQVNMPFLVESGGQKIQVLGTRFNINAYKDEEAIRTTLLEGAVRVDEGSESLVLKPGEQAQVGGQHIKKIVNIDPDVVMAWKNGLFTFRHAGIRMVARQLARWYDVDVEYQGAIDEGQSFTGEIGRDLLLSDVLNGLRFTRVHYRIEDRKLIILP